MESHEAVEPTPRRKPRIESAAKAHSVVVVEDDESFRTVTCKELEKRGLAAHGFPSTTGVMDYILEHAPDVLLLDLRLPGESGMDFLTRVRLEAPEVQVVVLTGHGSIEHAVEAMHMGAHDFLTKPVRLDVLEQTLRRGAERSQLERENARLRRGTSLPTGAWRILGASPEIESLRDRIAKVARTDNHVLILGENGTGKELVARNIHVASERSDRPFVTVNCAAIPEDLFASELFGHERGAFTGANEARPGLIDAAHDGTLFLDEVGELPLSTQPALLRAIQFGEVRSVGGRTPRTVNVRVVAATNRPMQTMISEATFREDLYYRLATLTIEIPPLRRRPSDIDLYCETFLARAAHKAGRTMQLEDSALSRLRAHPWPGNVRELENTMVQLSVFADADHVTGSCVAEFLSTRDARAGDLPTLNVEELERIAIRHALARFDGNKPAAAESLGVSLRTLYTKLDRYGLRE